MAILPLTELGPFGVEVDLDLSEELDVETSDALTDLLWHRHLLRFRRQTIDFDQQVALMKRFGPISRDHDDEPGSLDFVSIDPALGFAGTSRLPFHQDLSFSPLPLIALSLFGLDVEPGTTSTLFIDSAQVYRKLPSDLRDRIDGLEALHVFPAQGYAGYLRSTAPGGVPYDLRFPNTAHPLAMAHPVTGEKILFLSNQTDRIVGLSDAESEELMCTLDELTYDPVNILELSWDQGDLIVWDNLAVQHARGDQSHTSRRTLRRVVCGEKTFFEQHPQMYFEATADEPPVLAADA
jgi:taurine dioxygenase